MSCVNRVDDDDEGKERNNTFSSSSKTLYWVITRKYEIKSTAKCCNEELYPMLELSCHEMNILPGKTTVESKAREFQYKIFVLQTQLCVIFTQLMPCTCTS